MIGMIPTTTNKSGSTKGTTTVVNFGSREKKKSSERKERVMTMRAQAENIYIFYQSIGDCIQVSRIVTTIKLGRPTQTHNHLEQAPRNSPIMGRNNQL